MKLCVTGHDGSGKSVFSYVGIPPREMGPDSFDVWSTRGTIGVPDHADLDLDERRKERFRAKSRWKLTFYLPQLVIHDVL